MTLPLLLDLTEEATFTVAPDGHHKHTYLSYSQQKGPCRVSTPTLFTVLKVMSKNQRGGFSSSEEPPPHLSQDEVKTIKCRTLTII